MRRLLRWLFGPILVGSVAVVMLFGFYLLSLCFATDNISDESYTPTLGTVKSRVGNAQLGYNYWATAACVAAGASYDTLYVVRDFNGDGTIDSTGASADYARICRLDLWSTAPAAAQIDSIDVKWGNGATATDSVLVTFVGTAETMTPVVRSFYVRADWAVIHSYVTVGAGDIRAIAYCER